MNKDESIPVELVLVKAAFQVFDKMPVPTSVWLFEEIDGAKCYIPIIDFVPRVFDPGTSISFKDIGVVVMFNMPLSSLCMFEHNAGSPASMNIRASAVKYESILLFDPGGCSCHSTIFGNGAVHFTSQDSKGIKNLDIGHILEVGVAKLGMEDPIRRLFGHRKEGNEDAASGAALYECVLLEISLKFWKVNRFKYDHRLLDIMPRSSSMQLEYMSPGHLLLDVVSDLHPIKRNAKMKGRQKAVLEVIELPMLLGCTVDARETSEFIFDPGGSTSYHVECNASGLNKYIVFPIVGKTDFEVFVTEAFWKDGWACIWKTKDASWTFLVFAVVIHSTLSNWHYVGKLHEHLIMLGQQTAAGYCPWSYDKQKRGQFSEIRCHDSLGRVKFALGNEKHQSQSVEKYPLLNQMYEIKKCGDSFTTAASQIGLVKRSREISVMVTRNLNVWISFSTFHDHEEVSLCGHKIVGSARALVPDNFVWDPGRFGLFIYILGDKDNFEGVGKSMYIDDNMLDGRYGRERAKKNCSHCSWDMLIRKRVN